MKKWNNAEIVELNISETAVTWGDIENAFWENLFGKDLNGNNKIDTWKDLFDSKEEGGEEDPS